MWGSASKADSNEDNMKSYFRVPPSLCDMAGLIQEESKIIVSIISDIIKSNRGIRNDQELHDLLNQCSANSDSMSAFCNEVESSIINKVSDSLLILCSAVERLEEGRGDGALEELEKILNSENPFSDLLEKLENVRQRQEQLKEKLKLYNNKIKKKLVRTMMWRIAAGLTFTYWILSIHATDKIYGLVLMPPLLGAATSVIILAWAVLDKQCKSYFDGLKRQQDLGGLIKEHCFIAKTSFTIFGFERMEKKMDDFAKSIEKCIRKCCEDLKK